MATTKNKAKIWEKREKLIEKNLKKGGEDGSDVDTTGWALTNLPI